MSLRFMLLLMLEVYHDTTVKFIVSCTTESSGFSFTLPIVGLFELNGSDPHVRSTFMPLQLQKL